MPGKGQTKVWVRAKSLLGKGQIKDGIIDKFVQGEKKGLDKSCTWKKTKDWVRAKSEPGKGNIKDWTRARSVPEKGQTK